MAVLTNPALSNQAEVDGNKALRIVPRHLDHGSNGHYMYAGFTGILPAALGANSEIYQFRWTSGSAVALIRRIRISAAVSTTFFAAGVPVQVDMVRSTSWTAAGTGGTAITPAALMRKRNVGGSMGDSAVASGDMRIATTAALGAGTKTLDTLSMSSIAAPGPITASLNGQIIPPGTILFECEVGDGDYPLTMAQNEGFSIRSVAVPATGTWTAAITVEWIEMASY